jgi:predicted ATP-binding protein involved in virulence
MHIKKLKIENFRGIRNMELELHPKMNVFIGINGAGKSSVLDALGYLLRPPVHLLSGRSSDEDEFASQNPEANDFPDREIHCGMQESRLEFTFATEGLEDFGWELRSSNAQLTKGHGMGQNRTHLTFFNAFHWHPHFIFGDEQNRNVSLVVYYRVQRAVEDVSIMAWTNRNFHMRDAFIDALAPKVDFKEFFEWFRNREDLENEELAHKKNGHDRQLECVRKVIGIFCDALKDVRVHRRDPLRMVVTKNDRELRIEQLSNGEKCLLAMVGDLARRMAIANPSLDDPLHGEGVVLIDEVDLHLHPKWQRTILPCLMETFPHCQFIVTTHSPQILGEVKSEHVIILSDGANGIETQRPAYEIYGQTSGTLLEDLMQASERNEGIKTKIQNAFDALELGSIDDAKRLIGELREEATCIPDLNKLEMRLFRKEVVGK